MLDVCRLATCALLIQFLVVQLHAGAVSAQNMTTQPDAGPAVESQRSVVGSPPPSPDVMCQTLESAAHANDLPLDFLTRLLWQESRFNPDAVSRAGAQGIAQFMPKTGASRGLQNPFDPIQAITKSAELLRDLSIQFGNLGLAAAAYNAGPKRVQDWLAGHRSLPQETQAYIRIVTGRSADEWRAAKPNTVIGPLPEGVPCPELTKRFVPRRPPTSAPADKPELPWGVQLVGSASEPSALAAYHQLQRTHTTILAAHEPLVIRTPLGKNGFWYRVRVGTNSRESAEKLCASLRATGASCLVQRN
jgi:hypothetical protein